MPKLSVHAKDVNVSIQDPFPTEGRLTLVIDANTTETKDVSWPQLYRLRPQLTALELANAISYAVSTTELDLRADEPQLAGLPWITYHDLSTTKAAGGDTLNFFGYNLLGYQIKATSVMGDITDTDGYIEFEAVVPGTHGDDISIEVAAPHAGAATVGVVGHKITYTPQTAVSDYTAFAAKIALDAAASLLVVGTPHGTGATLVSAAEAEKHLSGGQGAGMEILLCEGNCDIVSASDTQIEVVTGAAAPAVATDTAILSVRIAGQVQSFPIILT